MPEIILASTSIYRKNLLQRLRLPFQVMKPSYVEGFEPPMESSELVLYRGRAKAESVSELYPDSIVIGSDQGLIFNGELLGKPHHFSGALDQLSRLSGQVARLDTALVLLRKSTHSEYVSVDQHFIQFRKLSTSMIRKYLEIDEPYDCAGSFKIESLGSALFESLKGQDPTAIEGLPLISLVRGLFSLGVDVLG